MEGIFNPQLFTANEEQFFRCYKYKNDNNTYKIKVNTVSDDNQVISDFVSRVVWPSSVFFPAIVFSNEELRNTEMKVLELGSGSGLLSVFFEKIGMNKVVASDCCDFVSFPF